MMLTEDDFVQTPAVMFSCPVCGEPLPITAYMGKMLPSGGFRIEPDLTDVTAHMLSHEA